jgi:transcriptional regulator with XRE-family HTH domain
MEYIETLGKRLKYLRDSRELLQSDVAAAVGITVSTYSNLETGYASSTKLKTAVALADFYGVSLDFLIGRTDDPRR